MKYAVCGILFDEDSHTTQDSAQNLDNYLSLTRLDATVEGNPAYTGTTFCSKFMVYMGNPYTGTTLICVVS